LNIDDDVDDDNVDDNVDDDDDNVDDNVDDVDDDTVDTVDTVDGDVLEYPQVIHNLWMSSAGNPQPVDNLGTTRSNTSSTNTSSTNACSTNTCSPNPPQAQHKPRAPWRKNPPNSRGGGKNLPSRYDRPTQPWAGVANPANARGTGL